MFHAVVVLLFLQFIKVSRINLIWCKSSARLIGVVLKMTGLLVTKAGYLCSTGFHVVFIHAAIEYVLLIFFVQILKDYAIIRQVWHWMDLIQ